MVNNLRIAACNRLIEDLAQIAAKQPALGEAAMVAAFGFEARGEVAGLAGPGAHPLGADIQQVRRSVVE